MSAGRDSRRRPEALRWTICFALALCFHAAGAAALLARWNDSADLAANAPVITIELAALPVAPDTTPNDLPPDVVPTPQVEPAPAPEKPVEKAIELPPEPQAEPQLAVTPPPKPLERPKEKKPKQKHKSLARAPSAAEHQAERTAAPAPGSHARNFAAEASWNSQVSARLERYKRAPPDAPNASGVAMLAFNVDRSGGVHHAHLLRSSGSNAIDRETLMLVERAQPMPPPPPEIPDAKLKFEVPIRYNMR